MGDMYSRSKYIAPDLSLLVPSDTREETNKDTIEKNIQAINDTLHTFKIPAVVTDIYVGDAVTGYELEMPPGVSVKRIETLSQDISYNLGCKGNIRVIAPIRGKKAVGLEVPNDSVNIVRLRELLESEEFKSSSPLTFALGKDIYGNAVLCNLEKMPHILMAGTTGSGKSVCLNSILLNIIYKASPEDVRLILVDPKHVELVSYEKLPHLLGGSVINNAEQALNALKWLRAEVDRRYESFSQNKVKSINEYNKREEVLNGNEKKLPFIVTISDEFGDFMFDSEFKKTFEIHVGALAQKARAAGIHLILATQRPSPDVITGTIRANLPSCIAFAVRSNTDSRIILSEGGAETLLGSGDMLYAPVGGDMIRVQGTYVDSSEIAAVTEYVKSRNVAVFDEEFTAYITTPTVNYSENEQVFDTILPNVLEYVIESGKVSTSIVQSRFSVGYARACRIIEQLEMLKFIGPRESSNYRPVYITREQYEEFKEKFQNSDETPKSHGDVFTVELSNCPVDEEEKEDKQLDPLIPEVLKHLIEKGDANTSLIQSYFNVGFYRACRILEQLERLKYIGSKTEDGKRAILITLKDYDNIFGTNISEHIKDFDALVPEVLKNMIAAGRANALMVQLRFFTGYSRANEIIRQMEKTGFIGSKDESGFHPILITKEEYDKLFGVGV